MSRGETRLSKRIEDLIETYSKTGTHSTLSEHRQTRNDTCHEHPPKINCNEDCVRRRMKSPVSRRRCLVSHKGSAPAAPIHCKEHVGWRKCLQSNKTVNKEDELPKDEPLENYQWTTRRRCIVSSKSKRKDEESPERTAENRIRRYHFNPRGRSLSPLKVHTNMPYPTKSQENAAGGYCRRRKECHNTPASETHRRCSPHHSKDRIALGLTHKQMEPRLSTRDEPFVEKNRPWSSNIAHCACPKCDERKHVSHDSSLGKQKRCSPQHSREHIAAYCPKESADVCPYLKSSTRHRRCRRYSSKDHIHSGACPKEDNCRWNSSRTAEDYRRSRRCHEDIQKPSLWELGPQDGNCWCRVVERPDVEQRTRNVADLTPTWKKRYPRKPAPPQTPVERQWNSLLYKRN